LNFTSVTTVITIEPGTPRDVMCGTQRAIEVPFTIETYTKTEFEHAPEVDRYYIHQYVGTIVLDGAMNALDFHTESP
jgi:hypothetical protein